MAAADAPVVAATAAAGAPVIAAAAAAAAGAPVVAATAAAGAAAGTPVIAPTAAAGTPVVAATAGAGAPVVAAAAATADEDADPAMISVWYLDSRAVLLSGLAWCNGRDPDASCAGAHASSLDSSDSKSQGCVLLDGCPGLAWSVGSPPAMQCVLMGPHSMHDAAPQATHRYADQRSDLSHPTHVNGAPLMRSI